MPNDRLLWKRSLGISSFIKEHITRFPMPHAELSAELYKIEFNNQAHDESG